MKRLPGILPSRGCTEPVAIALASALAARAAGGEVLRISVSCDLNTLKNAQGPGIPGTGGLRGAELAAALGALAGDPARELEVLASISGQDVSRARTLIEAGRVRVDLRPHEGPPRLRIEATVETSAATGRALLEGSHTGLVALDVNGEPATQPDWATVSAGRSDPTWEGWDLERLLALAEELDADDQASLLAALKTNLGACGWDDDRPVSADLPSVGERLAEVGSQARMEGRPITVMTSGFSGNQGLVASVPVWVVAQSCDASERDLARALAVSHLVGSYVRSFTGILSPLCNAVQAASAGAAAGCARLLGGGIAELERAAKRVLATSGGVVCDGAKPACSLKVGLGAALAIRSAQRVLEGSAIANSDGIAATTLENTARNLGRLADPGMAQADRELLDLILAKTGAPGAPQTKRTP